MFDSFNKFNLDHNKVGFSNSYFFIRQPTTDKRSEGFKTKEEVIIKPAAGETKSRGGFKQE
jgi:hypothetical protein